MPWPLLVLWLCSENKEKKVTAVIESSVKSEIFARVLFSRNFAYAYAKLRENKILAKWRNHAVFY